MQDLHRILENGLKTKEIANTAFVEYIIMMKNKAKRMYGMEVKMADTVLIR